MLAIVNHTMEFWEGGKGKRTIVTILKYLTSVQAEDLTVCTESCRKWEVGRRGKGE
jgi:hypothetical protein